MDSRGETPNEAMSAAMMEARLIGFFIGKESGRLMGYWALPVVSGSQPLASVPVAFRNTLAVPEAIET